MSEVKHTPGPWKIVRHMGFDFQDAEERDDPECQMGFAGPNGERVCWFGHSADYYPTEGDEPSEADARLIEAAPDLLRHLKASIDALERFGITDGGIPEAKETIAKAEGRS